MTQEQNIDTYIGNDGKIVRLSITTENGHAILILDRLGLLSLTCELTYLLKIMSERQVEKPVEELK